MENEMLLERLIPTVSDEVCRFGRELDSLFKTQGWFLGHAVGFPAMNLWEDEGHVYLEAELPGMDKESVEISFEDPEHLTLKGERKFAKPEKAVIHQQERVHGSFERTLSLPIPVEVEKVSAKFAQGILRISMPKAPAAMPRKIQIQG